MDRDDLVVVATSFDPTEACSTVLARASSLAPKWSPIEPAVLRHHLVLPQVQVEETVAVAALDGYRSEVADQSPEATGAIESLPAITDARRLVLKRVQVLDALHCSQEQSRMAGLAQRRGGVALGWDALQPET